MENSIETNNIAETVRDVMRDYAKVEDINPMTEFTLNSPVVVAVPDGKSLEDVTSIFLATHEFLKPARREGTAKLADLESLINWANRFKGTSSVLFAKPYMSAPTLMCIADYHVAGPTDSFDAVNGDPTARHCHHRGIYGFPLSDEWKAWTGISGQLLEKDDLGEFIEVNAKDIMDPTPAVLLNKAASKNKDWENRLIETAQKIEGRYGQLSQLLAMSKKFQIFEKSDLKVSTNRDTGESEIQFLNEYKGADGKPLNIPNLIIIAIPVFQNGALYRMPVRFRYRKSGGQIKFILSVYNPEKAFDASFKEAITEAEAATELPLFMGDPET